MRSHDCGHGKGGGIMTSKPYYENITSMTADDILDILQNILHTHTAKEDEITIIVSMLREDENPEVEQQ